MPFSHKKVRYAPRAPGLLFLVGGALALAACGEQRPDKDPAAEVVLSDNTDSALPVDDSAPVEGDAPGFDSVGQVSKPVATLDLPAPNGEQAAKGSIIDFLCKSEPQVHNEVGNATAVPMPSCELIIRTAMRGDRRILCDVAPCDAWAERGDLPQGIRGLQAEAWFTLADTYDPSGNLTGRVAKATRVSVAYTKNP